MLLVYVIRVYGYIYTFHNDRAVLFQLVKIQFPVSSFIIPRIMNAYNNDGSSDKENNADLLELVQLMRDFSSDDEEAMMALPFPPSPDRSLVLALELDFDESDMFDGLLFSPVDNGVEAPQRLHPFAPPVLVVETPEPATLALADYEAALTEAFDFMERVAPLWDPTAVAPNERYVFLLF